MGLFGWSFTKEEKRKPYRFTDEDRELAKAILQKKKEIELAKLQKEHDIYMLQQKERELMAKVNISEAEERLSEYEDEEDDDYGEDLMSPQQFQMFKMFKPAIDGIVQRINPNYVPPTVVETPAQPSSSSDGGRIISNEQLQEQWDKLPQQYKDMAKSMADNDLKQFLKNKHPNATEGDLVAALAIIRA